MLANSELRNVLPVNVAVPQEKPIGLATLYLDTKSPYPFSVIAQRNGEHHHALRFMVTLILPKNETDEPLVILTPGEVNGVSDAVLRGYPADNAYLVRLSKLAENTTELDIAELAAADITTDLRKQLLDLFPASFTVNTSQLAGYTSLRFLEPNKEVVCMTVRDFNQCIQLEAEFPLPFLFSQEFAVAMLRNIAEKQKAFASYAVQMVAAYTAQRNTIDGTISGIDNGGAVAAKILAEVFEQEVTFWQAYSHALLEVMKQ